MKKELFKIDTVVKDLIPEYDHALSFYKKAFIRSYYNADGIRIKIELISYYTIMVTYENGILTFNKNAYNYSNTTLRHVKEFLRQVNYLLINYPTLYNADRITKKDIFKIAKIEA